ncbi:MAG TPA: hypothetical protein VE027_03940 [Acidimicrobiia bacterium]|nr:hypothetical protein [Acidimicrobiia bacterium]
MASASILSALSCDLRFSDGRYRVGNQKDPLPAGADLVFRVVGVAGYTDESHGLSVVVVIPVVSQALM